MKFAGVDARVRYVMCSFALCLVLTCFVAVEVGFAEEGPNSTPRFVQTVMKVSPPTLVAAPADGEIKIDGDLSEAAWQSATPVGSFTLVLDTSMATRYPTTVRALWDQENLYLAMVCDEPNIKGLVTLVKQRDEPGWSDDRLSIMIDPTGAGSDYYAFGLTAGNVQFDARCKPALQKVVVYTPSGPLETFRNYPDADSQWNAEWPSAVAKSADQWTAEIAIPWASLGIEPDRQKLFRANFGRVRVTYEPSRWRRGRRRLNTKPEESIWSPPKGEVHTPALFGFLALAGADGRTPEVPSELEVAVPGLPGMPGVPSKDDPPKQIRFTVHPDGPTKPLTRFWDSLNTRALTYPGFSDRTYGKGYMRQARFSGGPRRRRRPRSRPTSAPATRPARALAGAPTSAPTSQPAAHSRPAYDPNRRFRTLDAAKEHNIFSVVTLRSRPEGVKYKTTRNARWGRVQGPPESDDDYKIIYKAYREYFQELYDRYGQEFFDSLRFEFWNEPDGSERFFAGTVQDYCNWYDWVAKALKDVSPTGKIGGPAVTGGGFDFTKAFLDHCRDGDNAATGGKGAPLDFVTFHTYGWRWQLAPMASYDTVNTIARFWHIIADAGFAGIETHITEWGVEPTGNASGPYFWFRKTHYAPVWMAKLVKDIEDARETYADIKPRVDGLSLCIAGLMTRRSPFAGNRTLFVQKWVPKPYYNGYVLLNELGDQRLKVTGPEGGRIGCLATTRPDGSLAVLVFHFKEYARTSPPEEDITVTLAGLPLAGKAVSQMRVDENTSNSYTAWVKMGSPAELTDELAEKLTAAAKVHKLPLTPKGGLVELTMPVNSVAVVLVESR